MVGTSNLASWNGHWWYSNGFWGTVVLDVFGPIHLSDIRILWLSNFFVPVSGTILWFCNRLARSAVRFVLNIWSIPAVIFFWALFCVVFARFDNLMSENRFELDAYFGRPFAFRYNQKPKISGVCLIYNCYPFSLKSHEQILQWGD